MQRDRRQDGISADKTADRLVPPVKTRTVEPLEAVSENRRRGYESKQPTGPKDPYTRRERDKNRSSFFFSLYTYNPHGYRAITADNTRPRFAPGLFWNPAVRVPVLAGTGKSLRCRAGWHDWAKVLDDDDRWCRQCLRCGEARP